MGEGWDGRLSCVGVWGMGRWRGPNVLFLRGSTAPVRTRIPRTQVVLTHGRSEVVLGVLERAAATKNFTVMVTEGRPEGSGALRVLLMSNETRVLSLG